MLKKIILLLLAGGWGLLYAAEIYNYPDLIDKPVFEEEEVDTNRKVTKLDYGLVTNESFYSLKLVPDNYPNLQKVLADIIMREMEDDPEKVLIKDFFKYDRAKKRILAGVREFIPEQAEDEDAINFGKTIQLTLTGSQQINIGYGNSFYITDLDVSQSLQKGKYEYTTTRSNEMANDENYSKGSIYAKNGFVIDQQLDISLKGKIANLINIDIKHNTRSRGSTPATVDVEYRGDKRDFVERIKLGKANFNSGMGKRKSEFIVAGGSSKETLGITASGGKGGFTFSGVIGFTRAITAQQEITVEERQYEKNLDIDFIQDEFFKLPDSNIVNYVYFKRSKTVSGTTNVVAWDLKIGDRHFVKVEDNSRNYTIDKERGILHNIGRRQGDSVLFYTYDGSNELPCSATNGPIFFNSTNITVNNTSFSNEYYGSNNLYRNFAVIGVGSLEQKDLSAYLGMRNHYRLASRSFDSDNFEMTIFKQNNNRLADVWKGGTSHYFSNDGFGRVVLNKDKGYYYFEKQEPFAVGDASLYNGFYEKLNPTAEDSMLYMQYSYVEPFKGYIDLDHNNINPSSVVVVKNGSVVDKTAYRVSRYAGRIYFKDKTDFLAGDTIKVSYEYEPFANTLQQIMLGGRLDYEFRENNYIGGSFVMASGQSGVLSSSHVGREATRQMLFDIDTKLSPLDFILRHRRKPFNLSLDGEVAFSLFDRNKNSTANRGGAIVKDFEGDERSFTFPKSDVGIYLTVNPLLEDYYGRTLGKSYFVDYYEYRGAPSPVDFLYSEFTTFPDYDYTKGNIKQFSTKPGPYVVSDGHRETDYYQRSLVFDYNFTNLTGQEGYLSFVTYLGSYFNENRDFSRYNTIEIVYKLVRKAEINWNTKETSLADQPGAVGFSLELGHNMYEDFDDDGIFDQELNMEDRQGFPFNYTNNGFSDVPYTHLGGGNFGEAP
ncbi:MAG TPA: hypothetical protein VKS21_12185, partial [Spirochaetota bacterium]|nr:hypothetical protein [Spirochaetota bacterium]